MTNGKRIRTPRAAIKHGRRLGAEEMAEESTRVDEPWTVDSIKQGQRNLRKFNWSQVRSGQVSPYQAVLGHLSERAEANEMLRQVRARQKRPTVGPRPDGLV